MFFHKIIILIHLLNNYDFLLLIYILLFIILNTNLYQLDHLIYILFFIHLNLYKVYFIYHNELLIKDLILYQNLNKYINYNLNQYILLHVSIYLDFIF